jgi:hypothetical protein
MIIQWKGLRLVGGGVGDRYDIYERLLGMIE